MYEFFAVILCVKHVFYRLRQILVSFLDVKWHLHRLNMVSCLCFCSIPRHVQLMLAGQYVYVKQIEKHIFLVDMCCLMKEARYNHLIGNACCIYDCTGWLAMASY